MKNKQQKEDSFKSSVSSFYSSILIKYRDFWTCINLGLSITVHNLLTLTGLVTLRAKFPGQLLCTVHTCSLFDRPKFD